MNDKSGETKNNTEIVSGKFDFGDPLFLHASDTSTLSIVNVKLKGTENYMVWANSMELALRVKNKMGFVDGSCLKPSDNDVLSNQWDRCNSVVLSWILNSISDELYLGQIYSRVASEVWQELKETYCKVDGSIIFNLHQKISTISQNGSPISDYYHKLNSLWKQFDTLACLPTCTCSASKSVSDFNQNIKLMQFLMGLDEVYQPIRSNLLTRDPLPTVKSAFAIISSEESHRTIQSGKSQPTAFATKVNEYKKKKH
ncbi:putative retrotransposon gag domain, retrotransposon Copia-like protein [Helianthus annuus]|nr:putative retrotransposon gag domain, retrotransposon Copia-like protein [Helianthus annuus]KAJ0697304.1 putative retrotransposon gag domain, retrotransposon Copia-like protein [Helianthus annuus]